MSRLRALDASYLGEYAVVDGRTSYWTLDAIEGAQGVLFQCPLCAAGKPVSEDGLGVEGAHYVLCWFTNPRNATPVPADAEPLPGRWQLEGTSLDDLTLHPSVHLTGPGCGWHGFVKDGDAT